MNLPGLPGYDAPTPAARRAALAAAPDAAIADALVALARATRDAASPHVDAIADAAALPIGEVLASPFGLRAVALAAAGGGSSVHLELRADLPWPDAFAGSRDDAVHTDPHGYWDRGILQTGKYRGFFADAPLGIWNPNHMAKWGPHELMHRAVGYVWHADLSRWEAYVAARLNELVPVVLWYGPDEALRLDGAGWDRATAAAAPAADVDAARWWTADDATLRTLAAKGVAWMRRGLDHFEREWAAIDEELRTGSPVPTPADGLDASSDAIAYVVGHYERLRSARFHAYSAALCVEGTDYDASLEASRERVEQAFDALLFGDISWSEADAAALRRRRRARDRGWRLAHHARVPEHALPELLERLPESGGSQERELAEADRGLRECSPRQAMSAVLATGHPEDAPARHELADGVASLAPAWLAWAQGAGVWEAVVDGFIQGAAWRRAPLSERLADAVREHGTPAATDLWRFEVAIARSLQADPIVERLCVPVEELPDDVDRFRAGSVRRSGAFRAVSFAHDPAPAHAAFGVGEVPEPGDTPPARYLIGVLDEAVSVVPLPEGLVPVWEALAAGAVDVEVVLRDAGPLDAAPDMPDTTEAWLEEWIAAGAVGWMPPRTAALR